MYPILQTHKLCIIDLFCLLLSDVKMLFELYYLVQYDTIHDGTSSYSYSLIVVTT